MRRLAAAALLWTLGAAAAGAATVEMGRAVYNQLCLHCHGRDMVNPGTASFDLRRFPRDDRARFFNSVTNGRGAMPAWGDLLRPGELDALWLYVAT
ncbi:MAG: cytochrome C oxidase Cbb3, partial [Rhodobacterales bacterium CG_4_9_14_3_um_filter_71_31]